MDNKQSSLQEDRISDAMEEKGGFFDKFIDGFVNAFGSKYHFAIATFGAAAVIFMIFRQGYDRWLLSTGLASNNYESAIEYFLAVGTLYQSARILAKQTAQMLHLQRETDEIDKVAAIIADRLDTGTPGGLRDVIERLDGIEKVLKIQPKK